MKCCKQGVFQCVIALGKAQPYTQAKTRIYKWRGCHGSGSGRLSLYESVVRLVLRGGLRAGRLSLYEYFDLVLRGRLSAADCGASRRYRTVEQSRLDQFPVFGIDRVIVMGRVIPQSIPIFLLVVL